VLEHEREQVREGDMETEKDRKQETGMETTIEYVKMRKGDRGRKREKEGARARV